MALVVAQLGAQRQDSSQVFPRLWYGYNQPVYEGETGIPSMHVDWEELRHVYGEGVDGKAAYQAFETWLDEARDINEQRPPERWRFIEETEYGLKVIMEIIAVMPVGVYGMGAAAALKFLLGTAAGRRVLFEAAKRLKPLLFEGLEWKIVNNALIKLRQSMRGPKEVKGKLKTSPSVTRRILRLPRDTRHDWQKLKPMYERGKKKAIAAAMAIEVVRKLNNAKRMSDVIQGSIEQEMADVAQGVLEQMVRESLDMMEREKMWKWVPNRKRTYRRRRTYGYSRYPNRWRRSGYASRNYYPRRRRSYGWM